ncbi:MAG TPA: acyl-CoA dehydrogenase family protein [Caulobacteraceae bacterium]|nr:acyl-CoA dehydrogenase family protein [Caulobacteraceae bacterium]
MAELAISMANTAPSEAFDEAHFVADVRAFLARALTEDLREAGRATIGVHADIAVCRIWHRRLFERGWIAPAWPRAWGGAGWGPRQRFLFDRECAANDAPILFAGGLRSVGPLLIEMGTQRQRSRYLPAILSGDDLWCQGFSEPGAGSDLAAISTRAERRNDDYVVNGSKIWTTGAHHSNRMFAIVRTQDGERRQQGLTFLLIDMDSPGLSVAPILGLAGEHEFNQVFFDDVRVPVAGRVGAENEGWAVAKRLMQLARANNTPAALLRRVLRRATQAVAAVDREQAPMLRSRLAALEIELLAFEQLELAALPSGRPGGADQTTPSMLKLIGSELHQKIAELIVEAAGPYAAAAWGARGLAGDDVDLGARAMGKHLAVRAATIYSGTSETQRNVIARQLLAL